MACSENQRFVPRNTQDAVHPHGPMEPAAAQAIHQARVLSFCTLSTCRVPPWRGGAT